MEVVKLGANNMVSKESVEGQLVRIGFNFRGFVNKAEVRELPNILLPDEEIYECVNGYYEGGFALLVATNVRVLLIDKKPFNYLTVEDVRFDMINEMDYSHRMMGAQISISVGSKNLRFRSYNQPRLRKLIHHVQHCIADAKQKQSQHQEGQNQRLEQINQQLQAYLLSQYQSQLEFNQRLHNAQMHGTGVDTIAPPQVVKPNPELADYLYSQSLLRQHRAEPDKPDPEAGEQKPSAQPEPVQAPIERQQLSTSPLTPPTADAQAAELYAEGRREVFGGPGKHYTLPRSVQGPTQSLANPSSTPLEGGSSPATQNHQTVLPLGLGLGLEVNPLRIAYSKLPMALRNRKFGRPSFHAHSQAHRVAPAA